MADYVTLLGAEEVRRAGSAMREAAQTIDSAASTIHEAMTINRNAMDEWLVRFEQILREDREARAPRPWKGGPL